MRTDSRRERRFGAVSTSVLISLLVVVVAFALFFYLSFKGVNLFLTVFACTFLVTLCTADGITSIFTSFLLL